jgi:hypothetical protein
VVQGRTTSKDERAVTDNDPTPSRRSFLVGAARVGSSAAALAWVTPKLSSTAFAADTTGSPPPGAPQPTEGGVQPQGAPEGAPVPGAVPTGAPAPSEAPAGSLPFTGSNTRPLVVGGTAAVVTGVVLTQASRPHRPEEQTT